MAQVCAARLLGRSEPSFTGADMSTKLKLLGVDVASLGDAHCTFSNARSYTFVDERKQVYKKLVVNEDGTRLLGGILVGDADDYGIWLQMMLDGTALPEHPEEMIVPAFEAPAKSAATGVAALPATAQICSCNNVSKGAICSAIDAGCTTIGALKTSTKAATSCGGCTSLVTQVLKAELASRGVAVNNHLCEHFPYSRQQLFHLVRVGQLKTFADVLAEAWTRPGLRHLQTGGRLDPRLVLERVRAEARQGGAAGHERLLPRQHAEGRHLLGRAARAGRRDHAGQADHASARSRRSTACTPRSPAASASICSARRCISCR